MPPKKPIQIPAEDDWWEAAARRALACSETEDLMSDYRVITLEQFIAEMRAMKARKHEPPASS